jgi:hypothetical protein
MTQARRLGGALLTVLALAAPAARALAQGGSAEALRIVREDRAAWRVGALTVHDGHDGHAARTRVRVEIVSGGRVIARLRLDPATGAFVAREAPRSATAPDATAALRPAAERALARLQVGPWAWRDGDGEAWRVALHCDGRAVGSVTVDVRHGRLRAHTKDHDEERSSR